MRFRIEASPDELREKAGELIERLADYVAPVAPALAESLEKALPNKEPELKYRALRDMKARADEAYAKQMQAMVKDIGKVLDRSVGGVRKSLPILEKAHTQVSKQEAAYQHVEGSRYTCAECEHWVPMGASTPPRCTQHGARDTLRAHGMCKLWKAGEPSPGRKPQGKVTKQESGYQENEYKTGYRCNRCAHYVTGGKCEKVEGSIHHEATCGLFDVDRERNIPIQKSGFQDHTKKIADKDDRAYQRVKQVLQRKGYVEADFEEGGALYGYSVNQLLEMARAA